MARKKNDKIKAILGYFLQVLFLIAVLTLCYFFADNQVKNDTNGEYPPMIKIEDNLYIITGHTLKNVDEEQLVQIGTVMDEISGAKPKENYQSNLVIKGAPIYIYNSVEAYENQFLLEGDILVFYDEQYVIFQTEDDISSKLQERKVQPY